MIRLVLAALLLTGFGVLIFMLSRSEAYEPVVIVQSSDCRACHPEVYAEWEASWHAMAWTDPFVRAKDQADNFKKKDCIPCHAPRPIFERGFRPGERVVERTANRDDGVDCISCHKLPEGGFAAARQVSGTPCQAVFHPGLASEALCAPCHNQHNTVNEWLDAPPHLKRTSCNDCHMPETERHDEQGRVKGMGKDHRFLGGHSQELLEKSFSLDHEILAEAEGKSLRICVKNDKSGHNLPTDSRHRALDLILTFYTIGGVPLKAMDGEREYGQEPGTYRLRFRNPYRSETGKEDTQIRAGEEAVLNVPLPEKAGTALVQLVYKLTPFMTDQEGVELYRDKLSLPAP